MPTLTEYAFHSHHFTPPKLSAYVDEAKTYAAEHTLHTLGIPTEGADDPTAAAAATAFPGTENSARHGAPPRVFGKPSLGTMDSQSCLWPPPTENMIYTICDQKHCLSEWTIWVGQRGVIGSARKNWGPTSAQLEWQHDLKRASLGIWLAWVFTFNKRVWNCLLRADVYLNAQGTPGSHLNKCSACFILYQ